MDCAGYIGIPFAERGRDRRGVDCWGLVCLVYRERLRVSLLDYSGWYENCEDAEAIRRIHAGEALCWNEVREPQPYDVILLREAGTPLHVGVVVAPGKFLHARRGIDSCVEDFTRPKWAKRVEGFYRHAA